MSTAVTSPTSDATTDVATDPTTTGQGDPTNGQNWIAVLMEAVTKLSNELDSAEAAAANTATMLGELEYEGNQAMADQLDADAKAASDNASSNNPSYQDKYSTDSAMFQANLGQQDGATKSAQQAVSDLSSDMKDALGAMDAPLGCLNSVSSMVSR